jgi:hypothetical protein
MRQASSTGIISGITAHPEGSGLAKEKRNVSAAEENKAIFRRYIEEIPRQGNLEFADKIFDRIAIAGAALATNIAVMSTTVTNTIKRLIAQPPLSPRSHWSGCAYGSEGCKDGLTPRTLAF